MSWRRDDFAYTIEGPIVLYADYRLNPSLYNLVHDALKDIVVTISDVYGYGGQVFDSNNDVGWIDITVKNNSAFDFKDVWLTISLSDGLEWHPYYVGWFIGEASWNTLEAGQETTIYARIKATTHGTKTVRGSLGAEIVPIASRDAGYREIEVHIS